MEVVEASLQYLGVAATPWQIAFVSRLHSRHQGLRGKPAIRMPRTNRGAIGSVRPRCVKEERPAH